MRNIQTYNALGPRRYIGINLWGLGEPPRQAIYAPIGLNISRFCAPSTSPRFRPSVFSTHPLLTVKPPTLPFYHSLVASPLSASALLLSTTRVFRERLVVVRFDAVVSCDATTRALSSPADV